MGAVRARRHAVGPAVYRSDRAAASMEYRPRHPRITQWHRPHRHHRAAGPTRRSPWGGCVQAATMSCHSNLQLGAAAAAAGAVAAAEATALSLPL